MLWLLLVFGCDLFEDELPSTVRELEGDAVVWTTPVTRAPAQEPSWVHGPLPGSPGAMRAPERQALGQRICSGADPTLTDRLEATLTSELGSMDYPGPWNRELLEVCTKPGPLLCDQVTERVGNLVGEEVPPALFELWHIAGGCLDPEIWSWMSRNGGSLHGTVDFLAAQDSQWRPVRDPSVPDLIAGLLAQPGLHRTHALQALGAFDDPGSTRVLLEHLATIEDPESWTEAAVWLYRQTDPRARESFERACAARPEAWQCVEALDPLADLDATVRGVNTDLSELLDRHGAHRAAVLESLRRCVRAGPEQGENRAGRCMRALEGAEPGVQVARALGDVAVDDPLWEGRIRAWTEHGGSEGIRDHLIALELLPEGTVAVDAMEPPVFVTDWFLEGHRGALSTERTPGGVLRTLLWQVPELRDAVVVERSTPASAFIGYWPVPELLVWMDGQRFRALLDEGSDLRRVAGMANTLAVERELDIRFIVVEPGDGVLWGPEAGLRTLVEQQLLEVIPREAPEFEEPETL